ARSGGGQGRGAGGRANEMIEMKDLTRHYLVGDQVVEALQAVTLSIPDGDYAAIMGPSGSGKSTLLHLLGCPARPTSGSYKLDGSEVGTLDEEQLAEVRSHKIGFIFQFFHLVPRL